jgi:DNA invertase Pin-like site-specific DNA recombinase
MIQNVINQDSSIRFVMYARTSSSKLGTRGIDDQFDAIELALKRLGCHWLPCGRYFDLGTFDQKAQMLDDVSANPKNVDLVIVESKDRFIREPDTDCKQQELLSQHDVRVLAVDSMSSDTTDMG